MPLKITKMRKYFTLLALLITTFSVTSCIDLVEEISINDNKSGHYELRLESEELGGLLSLTNSQIEVPAIAELEKKIALLKQQEGISNVKKHFQSKSINFKISFDFEDEASLNNAIYSLAEIERNIFMKKFLKIKKHKIVRPNLNGYLQMLIEEQHLMDDLPSKDMLKYINYQLVVNTPTEIKSVKGENAVVMNNKTTATNSFSFKDLVLHEPNISLKIKY